MSKAKLSSKGQLTIPIDVRRMLGLEQGDTVIFEPTEGGVRMRCARDVLDDLYGSVPPLKIPWKRARELAWQRHVEEWAEKHSSATPTSSSD